MLGESFLMAADNAEVPADTPLVVYRAAERKLSVKNHQNP